MVRIAHKPAEAVLHEIEERDIDLVVMGWRGESRHPRTAIGSNIDWIMRAAPADVAVLRADDLEGIDRLLVPIAYPEQARAMIALGERFEEERGSDVDLLHVLPPDLNDADRRVCCTASWWGIGPSGSPVSPRAGCCCTSRLVILDPGYHGLLPDRKAACRRSTTRSTSVSTRSTPRATATT